MEIREFHESEAHDLWTLKFHTIREVCVGDYSPAEVAVWAPDKYESAIWMDRLKKVRPFVAIKNGVIAGFSDLQEDGYIDQFYCSRHFIGKGVGGNLMRYIIQRAQDKDIVRLHSQVSLTAKPFFQHFGFKVVKPQVVNLQGVDLKNYVMERYVDHD